MPAAQASAAALIWAATSDGFSFFPGAFMHAFSGLVLISLLEQDLEIVSMIGHDSPPSS